jgi:CheY-like chemotaxis protein
MNLESTTECRSTRELLVKAREEFLAGIEAIAARGGSGLPQSEHADDPLRVLIVDDHRATTDTLFWLAVKWGHAAWRAYDGVAGMNLATAFRPDVLLLDMLMPNFDGFEVAMQFRRQGNLKHCFIVAVTGRTDPAHRDQCYAAGVDLFLTKPVPPSDMQTLLSLESNRARGLQTITNAAAVCRECAVMS